MESRDRSPVACSLTGDQFADRGLAWRALLDGWLMERTRIPDGVRLTLHDEPGVAETAEELMSLEAECCAWMHMELLREVDVVLVITGDDSAAGEVIAGMFA